MENKSLKQNKHKMKTLKSSDTDSRKIKIYTLNMEIIINRTHILNHCENTVILKKYKLGNTNIWLTSNIGMLAIFSLVLINDFDYLDYLSKIEVVRHKGPKSEFKKMS